MPRKTDNPAAARIRDNQRRSRSRRAGLVQELQERVREYELKGVEANVEMQTAARKVLRENALLRKLLAQHNISEDVINAQLQTQPEAGTAVETVSVTASTREVASPEVACWDGASPSPRPSPSPFPSTEAFTDIQHINPSHLDQQNHVPYYFNNYDHNHAGEHDPALDLDADFLLSLVRSPSRTPESDHYAQESDASVDEAFTPATSDYSICPNDDECFCAPEPHSKHDHLHPATEMSCETAALILADLRRHTDLDSIRISLGCSEETECMVKTSAVLQLMD